MESSKSIRSDRSWTFIDFLIGEGYIDPGEGFRPIIRVTPKGRQFLKERPPIVIPAV